MADKDLIRKLAAIFYADVAGYSRLTGADEEGTHKTLSARLDAISTLINDRGGKVLHYAGDAILAEFASVVVAVACAIDIQRDLADRNRNLDEKRKLQFRIGVNLGDVIVDRGELYGDGVNIAARLESLADPGGICISRKVLNEVRDRLEVGFEFLGDQSVKNIDRPIQVYKVLIEPEAVGKMIGETPARSKLRSPLAIAAGLALVAVGLGFWQPWQAIEPPGKLTPGLPTTGKPSIAVLPFDNMSNDPEQDYFSDGITEDLITDLAQLSGLRVIARNSVFTYKGRAVKVQDVARDLGVTHVLEGSVRKVGDMVRINVQLIDARAGDHLWAERFDRKLTDIFALQDEVCEKIVASLKLKLSDREKTGLLKRYTDNVEAYELFLRGQREFFRFNKDGNMEARKLYLQATELDPNFARAYANLGWTHARDYQDGWSVSPQESLALALKLATKARKIDETSSQVHWVLGQVFLFRKNYDAALKSVKRAIELSPSNPDPKILLARVLAFSGNSKESIRLIEEAIESNPFYPMQYKMNLGIAHFASGEYDKATDALHKAIERNPDAQRVRMWLAATYANAGDLAAAAWEFEELLTLNPSFSMDSIERSIPFRDDTVRDRLVNGLLMAAE